MSTQANSRESESQKSQRLGTFTPIGIKTIAYIVSNGAPYMLNEIMIETVCLVCHVEEFKENKNTIELVLRDDTGMIFVKIFRNAGSTQIKALQNYNFNANGYAGIIGTINIQNNIPYIVVNSMKNIENYSEVIMHKTQVLWACLIRNHVLKVPLNNLAKNLNMDLDRTENNSNGLENNQKIVIKAIKDFSKGSNGVNKSVIYKNVRLMPNKIDEILTGLVNFGFLIADEDFEIFHLV